MLFFLTHRLKLADRLWILELKQYCAEILCRHFDATNAVDVFLFAKQHRAESLAIGALDFISARYPAVKKSQSFRDNSGHEFFQHLATTLARKPRASKSTSFNVFALLFGANEN